MQWAVERPRLLRSIETPSLASITTVTAGAGFGKSILANQWAAQATMDVHWLQLGATDNDPDIFLSRLGVAIQHALPDRFGEWILGSGGSEINIPLQALLDGAADAQKSFCIIIDNAHLLSNPEVVVQLNTLINGLSPLIHLMLLSRCQLPLRLGRLRSEGRVREITNSDLRFTELESIHLLAHDPEIRMSANEARTLWSATGGWASGMRLLGLSSNLALHIDEAVPGHMPARHSYLDDYIREEILEDLAPDVLDFLVESIELPLISAEFCNHVLEREDCTDVIATILQDLPFLAASRRHPEQFRFHQMLVGCLQQLAQHDGAAVRRRDRAHRSSQWFLANGDVELAVELALESNDERWITRMLDQIARPLAERSDFEALVHLLERMPSSIVDSNHDFSWWNIAARLGNGRTSGMADMLASYERAWKDSGGQLHLARCTLGRGMLAYHEGRDADAKDALNLALAELPTDATGGRMCAQTLLGNLASRDGKAQEARAWLAAAEADAQALPLDEQWAWRTIGPDRGNAYALRGDLFSAMTKYRQLIAELPPALHHLEGMYRVRLVSLLLEHNRLEAAKSELDLIAVLAEGSRQQWRHDAVIARGRYYLALENRETAEAVAASYVKEVRREPGKNQLVLILARIWLDRGELSLVESWLHDMERDQHQRLPIFGDVDPRTLAIELDLARNDFEKAAHEAQALATEAAAANRWAEFLGFSVRNAVAQFEMGRVELAHDAMRPAIRIGARGGFVRSFHLSGHDTLSMFKDLWGEEQDFLRLKGALRGLSPETTDILTRREVEVLRLVALGRSNQQIADSMFISVNTVRNHLVRISRRLDVQSRSEAVAQARRLQILD